MVSVCLNQVIIQQINRNSILFVVTLSPVNIKKYCIPWIPCHQEAKLIEFLTNCKIWIHDLMFVNQEDLVEGEPFAQSSIKVANRILKLQPQAIESTTRKSGQNYKPAKTSQQFPTL